jgi:hypothetical protein
VVTGDGGARIVLRASDGGEVASWPVDGAERPDLALVDALARLQLVARRLGCSIRLRHASAELLGLLDLLGLAEVVTDEAVAPNLGLQMDGESEGCEELRVEEVVVMDDPVA